MFQTGKNLRRQPYTTLTGIFCIFVVNVDYLCYRSADGTFGWLAKGGVLEVFGMQTGERWAAWYFGSAGPDLKTVISAVCQFGTDCSAACLAVATAQDDFNSFKIYLFDICKSSIVKVVQLPFLVCLNEF